MRALVLLFLLSTLFPALAFTADAGEILVSKSAAPTCHTIIRQFGTERTIPGYETYFRLEGDRGLYHRWCDFLGNSDAVMSDIGMPTRYEDAVNTTGLPKPATHAKVLKNGTIRLY